MTLSTTMTAAAIVAIYNENAAKLGKPAMTGEWKGNKVTLIMKTQDMIDAVAKDFEQPVRRDTNATEADVAPKRDAMEILQKMIKQEAKPVPKAIVTRKIIKDVINAPKPAPSTREEIEARRDERRVKAAAKPEQTINAWCAANGINGKVARAKLRRQGFKAPYGPGAFKFLADAAKK